METTIYNIITKFSSSPFTSSIALVVVFYSAWKFFEWKQKWEVFKNAKALSFSERAIYHDKNSYAKKSEKVQKEIRDGIQLESYLNEFQDASWRKSYRSRLRHVLIEITKLTDDKLALKIKNKDFISSIFGCQPFTSNSFNLCFRLALIYPLVFFMVGWLIGGDGRLANIQLLSEEANLWQRVILVSLWMFSCFSLFKIIKMKSSYQTIWLFVFFLITILSGIFATVFSGASNLISVVAVTISSSISIAVTLAFSKALYSLGIITVFSVFVCTNFIASFFVGIIFLFLVFFEKFIRVNKWLIYYLLSICLVFFVCIYISINLNKLGMESLSLLLFFVVLPISNVIIDWLSLGFTRGLLMAISANIHNGVKVFLSGVLDIILAILLMLVLVAVLVTVISSINRLVHFLSGQIVVNLNSLFYELWVQPFSADNLWVYLMIFSTLLPTLLHIGLISLSLMYFSISKKNKDEIRGIINGTLNARKSAFKQYVLVNFPVAFLVLPTLVIAGFVSLLNIGHGLIGNQLFFWALSIAEFFDPIVDREKIFSNELTGAFM